MNDIQRASVGARWLAVAIVVVGAAVGSLLLLGFWRYRGHVREWILSEPALTTHRIWILLLLVGFSASAPLFGFAAYLWWLGGKVVRAQQFPPPGYPVLRDTPVLRGPAALSRARGLKILAVVLGVASILLWLLFQRLAVVLGASPV
jgi:hypothetical protein